MSEAQFFDGGWCWMSHPDWNDGRAIPVYMDVVGGVNWYYPFDPQGASEFEWDRRDNRWEQIVPPVHAAVIEAAPQLLEAVQAFMALDRSFNTICDAHLDAMAAKGGRMAQAVKLARAAIVKATGGSHA